MKLIASTPIKLGTKDGIHDIAEGEPFTIDDKAGDKLVGSGAASLPVKPGKGEADKQREEEAKKKLEIEEANAKAEAERAETARREAAEGEDKS